MFSLKFDLRAKMNCDEKPNGNCNTKYNRTIEKLFFVSFMSILIVVVHS